MNGNPEISFKLKAKDASKEILAGVIQERLVWVIEKCKIIQMAVLELGKSVKEKLSLSFHFVCFGFLSQPRSS